MRTGYVVLGPEYGGDDVVRRRRRHLAECGDEAEQRQRVQGGRTGSLPPSVDPGSGGRQNNVIRVPAGAGSPTRRSLVPGGGSACVRDVPAPMGL